jgi:hypothetical protein
MTNHTVFKKMMNILLSVVLCFELSKSSVSRISLPIAETSYEGYLLSFGKDINRLDDVNRKNQFKKACELISLHNAGILYPYRV